MDNFTQSENTLLSTVKSASLPNFETLRYLAECAPKELEALRVTLCQKVIDDAPSHAKKRLAGLLFQLNSRQLLNSKHSMPVDTQSAIQPTSPLKAMQTMLKDLHAMQAESIYLSTRKYQKELQHTSSAIIYPFKHN